MVGKRSIFLQVFCLVSRFLLTYFACSYTFLLNQSNIVLVCHLVVRIKKFKGQNNNKQGGNWKVLTKLFLTTRPVETGRLYPPPNAWYTGCKWPRLCVLTLHAGNAQFHCVGSKSPAVSGIVSLLKLQTWFICLIQNRSFHIMNAGTLRCSGLCKLLKVLFYSTRFSILGLHSKAKLSTRMGHSALEV